MEIYFEIPISGTGNVVCVHVDLDFSNDFRDVGYKQMTRYVRFTKIDSTIYLNEVNAFVTSIRRTFLRKAIDKNFADAVLYSYKIAAYTPDSTAVVIDVTPIFTTDERICLSSDDDYGIDPVEFCL